MSSIAIKIVAHLTFILAVGVAPCASATASPIYDDCGVDDSQQCQLDLMQKKAIATIHSQTIGVTEKQANPDSYLGCKSGGSWSRPYGDVALTSEGATSCLQMCLDGGYQYAGLECPMGGSSTVHCQCANEYDINHGTGSCERGDGHCNGATMVGGYHTGGYDRGSVYDLATWSPTPAPTAAPTAAPTQAPTPAPTAAPTPAPTQAPTPAPTPAPTAAPTPAPTQAPFSINIYGDPHVVVADLPNKAK